MDSSPSVCCRCGACCATYRVTLPRVELASHSSGWVPNEMTEPYTPTTACMREHPDMPGRCIALVGVVGESVRCTIYERRPVACRDFAPLSLLDIGDEACNEARRRHGLLPLGGL
ncbi:YkgJ family cysteine cluster protein [Sulfuricystis multivorans]|uniref:YkgJ family cysteine cluster protein n=1 Tax=Sulfuricystis multivorans TaxID=2211108 RepID=UPI000F81E448|nr:YkgJ family cysteine cluster protein [Sulfuricystis multivorans]